jgi:hypothetical protein
MKKIIMIMAVATALFSCGQKQDSAASSTEAAKDSIGGLMTSTDEKTLAFKESTKAYVDNDSVNYGKMYADNVRTYFPNDTTVDLIGKKEHNATFLGHHKIFSNIQNTRVRTMTITLGNGQTWTNTWGVYTGKGIASGKDVIFPYHIVDLWQGDKIVAEYHFSDTKPFEVEAQAAAAKK